MSYTPMTRQAVIAVAEVSADGQSGSFQFGPCDRVYFLERVTVIDNAGDSMILYYEFQDSGDSQWYPLANSDVLGAVGVSTTVVDVPPQSPIRARYDVTIPGAPGDGITFGVTAIEVHGGGA
tara:strand:+ start:292 stop:657 length:366 start_codon:yes stop_codon:yes gene_type:complete